MRIPVCLAWFPSRRLERSHSRQHPLRERFESAVSRAKAVTKFTQREFRRMIYQHKIRMEPVPIFGAFDAPDAGQTMPRRKQSTTAIQALNLFNSSFGALHRLCQSHRPTGHACLPICLSRQSRHRHRRVPWWPRFAGCYSTATNSFHPVTQDVSSHARACLIAATFSANRPPVSVLLR